MKQFGPKAHWIKAMPCCVTGDPCSEGSPWVVDAAHVGKSRGAGGGPERLAPLRRDVHSDFDGLPEDRFENLWGVSKEWIRQHAELLDVEWQRLNREAA